jgi:hypothetical protein
MAAAHAPWLGTNAHSNVVTMIDGAAAQCAAGEVAVARGDTVILTKNDSNDSN